MRRGLRLTSIAIVVIVAIYFMGPEPDAPKLSNEQVNINCSVDGFKEYVSSLDAGLKLKEDNNSRVIFLDDKEPKKTNYTLLYLHGFSASWYEGYPTHINFAERFGMNLYIPRLAAHGIETRDPLLNMTPDALYDSAREALFASKVLGEEVVIMGTSTGCTLALKLAADFPDMVSGLILLSPNIKINNPVAPMLSMPWGLQIARANFNSKYRVADSNPSYEDSLYWYSEYRLEATVYLQQLVDYTMNADTYEKVTAPLFLGYYYKDEEHQDPTVRVDAMIDMFNQVATVDSLKVKRAFPNAGGHVIGCEHTSGSIEEVLQASVEFWSKCGMR